MIRPASWKVRLSYTLLGLWVAWTTGGWVVAFAAGFYFTWQAMAKGYLG